MGRQAKAKRSQNRHSEKYNAGAFKIVFFALLADVFYRGAILRQPVKEFWDVALIFLGACAYVAIRNVMGGGLSGEVRQRTFKFILPISLVGAAVYSGVINWLNPGTPWRDMIINAVSFFIGFAGLLYLMYYLSRRRRQG